MRSEASAGLSRIGGQGPGCSACASGAVELTFTTDEVPDRESWERFHAAYHELQRESDRLLGELAEARIGLAGTESLFRISPFPIMEQDYTQVEQWMDQLRAEGVKDIRERLTDIDAIRAVVPLIWIVGANPAAVRAVGLPIEELIGPIDPRIVNDESYGSWISQFEAVWNRTPEAHAAFVAGRPNGQTYDAESTLAASMVDGEPDFSRAMFTIVDVSEHRSEERRMEELIDTKNKFLASISHEIRTPLTAIVGFSQILEEDDTMDQADRKLLVGSIGEQAQEMSDMIEDLLVAARSDSDQVKVSSVPIDVAQEVRRTLTAGGQFTDDVRFERPADNVTATADPARVRQILRNLLTNADRYGGPDVAISISGQNGWVEVDVSDDGPGIPPGEWESIFQLYQRAHSDDSRHESLGIGLAVSRQLAELMGGSLQYARENERSVFRLRLPGV